MGTHPIFESDFDCLTELRKMTKKLKVVVVGDRESGKSLFANIVASNQTDAQPLAEFARPTGHCRIVEFERQIDSQTVDVEVWDISGDLGQEAFWPVYADEMDGLIVMTKDQVQKEQSLLWVNGTIETVKQPTIGFKVTNDVLSEPEKTRSKFAKFLQQLSQVAQSNQERQERSMVN